MSVSGRSTLRLDCCEGDRKQTEMRNKPHNFFGEQWRRCEFISVLFQANMARLGFITASFFIVADALVTVALLKPEWIVSKFAGKSELYYYSFCTH